MRHTALARAVIADCYSIKREFSCFEAKKRHTGAWIRMVHKRGCPKAERSKPGQQKDRVLNWYQTLRLQLGGRKANEVNKIR